MESHPHSNSSNEYEEQLENLKAGVREISHEINNPLGIIRMAVYFLQSTNPVGEKREHYFKVIDEGLERIEQSLQQLKYLRENPSTKIESTSGR
jgi:nitrogen-specific signal transduction histidine kinase